MPFTSGQSGGVKISELKKGAGSIRNMNEEDQKRAIHDNAVSAIRANVSDDFDQELYDCYCINMKACLTSYLIKKDEEMLGRFKALWKDSFPELHIQHTPSEQFMKALSLNKRDDSTNAILSVIENQQKWIQDEINRINRQGCETSTYKLTILNGVGLNSESKYWSILQEIDRIKYGFEKGHKNNGFRIPLVISSEEPYHDEGYRRLGYYTPETKKITIVEKGIETCSSHLKCDADILRAVVLAHEYGHYITHTSNSNPSDTNEDFDIVRFGSLSEFNECIAQLIALKVCSECGEEYLNVFWKLAYKQKYPYNLFREYTHLKSTNIMDIISDVKENNELDSYDKIKSQVLDSYK